jgi:hypothetical protein
MPSVDRATRLGTIIAIVAVAAIFLAGAGLYALIRFAPTRSPDPYNPIAVAAEGSYAGANVVMRRYFQKKFAASAVLDLPPVPPQNDSPSLQITFYQRNAMVQGGIIRRPQDRFRMTAFLEYSNPTTPGENVRYFGLLSNRPHEVSIAGDTAAVDFAIDGKVLFRMPRERYLPIRGGVAPWVMLGTYVANSGNAASGTISRIAVRGDRDAAMAQVIPRCVVTKGGLEIRREGSTWILGGRNTAGVPVRYDHCAHEDLS